MLTARGAAGDPAEAAGGGDEKTPYSKVRVLSREIAVIGWVLWTATLIAQRTLEESVHELIVPPSSLEVINPFRTDRTVNDAIRALPPEALRVVSRWLEYDEFSGPEERFAALHLTFVLLNTYAGTSLDVGRVLDAVRKILDAHSDDGRILSIAPSILSSFGTEEQDLPRFEALLSFGRADTRNLLILAGRNLVRRKRGEAAATQWARTWDAANFLQNPAPLATPTNSSEEDLSPETNQPHRETSPRETLSTDAAALNSIAVARNRKMQWMALGFTLCAIVGIGYLIWKKK